MCGRYANVSDAEDLVREFQAVDATGGESLRDYNIAPTARVPIVIAVGPGAERRLGLARWGLIPAWAKDPGVGSRMFNARAESVASKPAFRTAFRTRRCLVPASGYYEWMTVEETEPGGRSRRRPYFVRSLDGAPLAFAGLYETWRGPDGTPLTSCTVITTTAAGDLPDLHERSPVILSRRDWTRWLDPSGAAADLSGLLAPAPAGTLVAHQVDPAVGNVRNNRPDLVEPLAPAAEPAPPLPFASQPLEGLEEGADDVAPAVTP
jgi:putative SOS response-associated peptidase YedK